MKKREVQASVKDERLVQKRRDQMIKGAVTLFKQKGFHRTTTREIAKAAGFSIGTLYEYIRTKEDVLYLVCDSIYDHVSERLQQDLSLKSGTLESLKLGIANFFQVMDEMQAEVLVMYQEVKSLSKDALPYVLKKEMEMVAMFEDLLARCVENGELKLSAKQVEIIAHNIFVQGQMWGFRRWALRKLFTLEEYIELQTELLLTGISKEVSAQQEIPQK
ncbi:TetR/AcrR family transcriptional regulator [Neobacillus sp. NPDC058068]|uniref:TetR/AcrR family transcriptional regulator n=1 Tax=Neobacillus sp. NPDC058068 TaxID=3346325 RepID=UPI0036DE85D5